MVEMSMDGPKSSGDSGESKQTAVPSFSGSAGRHSSLDYLRGLMAFTIMVYHYTSWSVGAGNGVLAKLGLYGVSVFYVLSGLSMTIAYQERLQSTAALQRFFVKRAFRIAPLFWFATTGAIVLVLAGQLQAEEPLSLDLWTVVTNYTLTFGFVAPDSYFATGAWSIGNEIVFYCAFPVVLWIARKGSGLQWGLVAGCLIAWIPFAFQLLDQGTSLSAQWGTYINPLNQFPFFVGGMLIGLLGAKMRFRGASLLFFALMCVAVFCLYPTSGERIEFVTGVARLSLSISSVLFVLAVYRSGLRFEGRVDRWLSFLGEASYSVYLLHPLIATPIILVSSRLTSSSAVLALIYLCGCVPATLLLSWLSYRFLEKPFMALGRRSAGRIGTKAAY